ncbi:MULTISPECIES: hypothetical protein [Cupriavidus]
MEEHPPPLDDEINRLFNEALAGDVQKLMRSQIGALAASDGSLLILITDLVNLLIESGVIDKNKLLSFIDNRLNSTFKQEDIPYPNILSTIYRNFKNGLQLPSEGGNGDQKK